MKKILSILLALTFTLTAQATVMGLHTTAGGKTVNLSGLEWLEWSNTYNQSASSILTNLGSGGLYDGWRVATRSEFEALFDSLWGGTVEGWHSSNRDGGDWLFNNFGSAFGGIGGSNVYFDYNSSSNAWSFGHWRGGGSGNEGWFHDIYGLSTGLDSVNTQQFVSTTSLVAEPYNAFALVRATSNVPDTGASLLLLGMGLTALIHWRRRMV